MSIDRSNTILIPSDCYEPIEEKGVFQEKKRFLSKRKKWILWIIVCILLLFVVFPYIKVELLSINADEKLKSFDLSGFGTVLFEDVPTVYDCKIFSYHKEQCAKVLYVLGDCEYGIMVKLEWNDDSNRWDLASSQVMWSVYGGSASEFYWPLYYGDKLFGEKIHPTPAATDN